MSDKRIPANDTPYVKPLADYSETPSDIFAALKAAYLCIPEYIRVYRSLANIFYRLLDQNTRFATIRFNSPYAKTTYLLKEHGADAALTLRVNDLRVRLNAFSNADDKSTLSDTLADNCLSDITALRDFTALILDAAAPEQLRDINAPSSKRRTVSAKPETPDYIRFMVSSWDDHYIYGKADGYDGTYKIEYTREWQGKEECRWSYIKDLLKPDCQINLIRPHINDDIITAQLLIYEPDYLVNITDISGCFQPHGHNHLNSLINKIKTNDSSEAILLGHLASQLLDDEINLPTDQKGYNDSAKRFYRANAFAMLATDISGDFHKKAQQQRLNIKRAIEDLPSAFRRYDRGKLVLEPSFYSQILGLQGRVDMLQQDMSLLIEQKSGKASFPEPKSPNEAPTPSLQHIIQMMLYGLIIRYNYPDEYAKNGGITSFLLYSKYDVSLCGVGEVWPKVLFEAIKIRNCIVASEFEYANNGFGILDTLRPEDLRLRPCADALWDKYTHPQLLSVLGPIKSASDLERAYFHRLMKFVANEHLLSKIGNTQSDDHGLASLWLNPLDIKLQTGNIYAGMTLISPDSSHKGQVTAIKLHYSTGEDNVMANFRKGDIVVLYPYATGTVPDACNVIITRCTISDIKSDTVTLHLRAPQADARLFMKPEGTLWAIEHDLFESSYNVLYRGIHSFLTAESSRRDLLLLQRKPQIDRSVKLTGSYGDFDDLALRVKQAQDLFLIIGPPGTGKTSFGLLTTLKEQLTQPGSTVLIASYTNRAVDEICSKLVKESIDFIRIGSTVSADPAYSDYFIDAMVDKCQNLKGLNAAIKAARVIVGTTTSIGNSPAIFKLKMFDLAIIDEASQILEPHMLPILTAKHGEKSAVKKLVLIGDHKQLPAVVRQSPMISAVTEPILNGICLTDCRLSLFERLLKVYGKDPGVTYMLTRQGRMHEDIAEFPNKAFYGGMLGVVPLSHQTGPQQISVDVSNGIRRMLTNYRMSFVAVDSPGQADYVSDKVNMPEAKVIAAIVAEIYRLDPDNFSANDTVGVIVPYRNQIATVRSAISNYGITELTDIAIDTVERYQGSERDNIIFGFTIQRYYQLQFMTGNTFEEDGAFIDRKLNVAMTRAKQRLVLVGEPGLLSKDYNYYRLIEHIRNIGGYVDAGVDSYVSGDF